MRSLPLGMMYAPLGGRRAARSRRGVLLLVVLSMLVLFALIGITFVLVASQSRRAMRGEARQDQQTDTPSRLLDDVFSQIVRDTTNPRSSLRGHSLLNDMYGNDGATGTVASATAMASGQFVEIVATTVMSNSYVLPGPTTRYYLSTAQLQTPGYMNGCVLTMTSGAAKDQSTRIVGWGYSATGYVIRVLATESINATTVNTPATPANSFIVNGRPFNGSGFGFNPGTGKVDVAATFNTVPTPSNVPFALLPNGRFFPGEDSTKPGYNASYTVFGGLGGADEDHDAPSPQDMLLAYMPIRPTRSSDIIPSMHRPDMLGYLRAQYPLPGDPFKKFDIGRMSMARPQQLDNSAFPTIDETGGPWDVDNDGDGIADSIWIDVGLPVQTGPDGRRFKPMAAILCFDLDGRLNVNAHGNPTQASAAYNQPIVPGVSPSTTIANYVINTAGTPPASLTVYRGSGYGPAEINLSAPGGIFITPLTDYLNFFKGGVAPSGVTYEGRYGEYTKTSTPYSFPLPGTTGLTPSPGRDDILASLKRFNLPNPYYGGAASSFNSPSDFWGRGMVAVDYAGQPVWTFLQQSPTVAGSIGVADPELPNDPYTLNLSRSRVRASSPGGQATTTANDNTFTPGELERVLRRFDVDASTLPDRLRWLLDPNNNNNLDLPHTITTDSYDLPSPSVGATRDLAELMKTQDASGYYPSNVRLVDLLKAKLILGGGYTLPLSPADQSTINTRLLTMLPPELVAGVRFDLNRPFGNGQDDNGNGVVDEPTFNEFTANNETIATWTTVFGAVGLDLNNDGAVVPPVASPSSTPINSDIYARQQYAKLLYILMMLVSDQSYTWSQEVGITAAQQKELSARRIAQWAVNVVDFRDSDAIMTPFEYDVDPFNANGWSVDGVIGAPSMDDDVTTYPDRRLVWGCENPELLLTEAMAIHDRAVTDDPSDNGSNGTPNDRSGSKGPPPDTDYDQFRVPQGSLFLEFYCPRSPTVSQGAYPRELYNAAGKLELGVMAPAAAGTAYPVWRVAITESRATPKNDVNTRVQGKPDSINFDPAQAPASNDPFHFGVFDTANSDGAVTIERIVWFTSQDPAGNPDAARIYYNKLGRPTALDRGQYALLGPRDTTPVGRNGATTAAQRIELNPPAVYDTAGQNIYTTKSVNPPLGIVCSSATLPAGWNNMIAPNNIGVSVTEPLFSGTYYPAPPASDLKYTPPLDEPIDSKAGSPLKDEETAGISGILATGTKPAYKTALLQRLANPLVEFDAIKNPYITVDWQPIDLTVFNGEKAQTTGAANLADPDDPSFQTPPATIQVGSRERGSASPAKPVLWNSFPQQPTNIDSAKGTTGAVFDYDLTHTLGFLNRSMGAPWGSPPPDVAGYKGVPDPAAGITFQWLSWNNRPFASNMELLLVPATSCEQLLRQFSSAPATATSPYDATVAGTYALPCQHLFNFMLSSDGLGTKAPYFYRILEYLQVPSPFVGTETYFRPASVGGALTSSTGLTEQELFSQFDAPFSKFSNFRDPGRVNINTIPSLAAGGGSPVWDAILNYGPGPRWEQIVASRRGDLTVGNNVTTLDSLKPSYFSNPFRTAGGAQYTLPGVPVPTTEVDVTLLRRDTAATPARGLFEFPASAVQTYFNPDRNPYFRYQPHQRLANLLTTRSNVYAIWITVGYFEVSPGRIIPPATTVNFNVYPDGLQLGAELGSDSGNVKRHRAFYIFDRSIPVGFEPGKDHNVENGVLLRRFIE